MISDLFNKFIESIDNKESVPNKETILFVDGLNMFIRSFLAVPTVNNDGKHIGAIVGFMRSLASAIDKFKPTKCIIVFDGSNSTYRRRQIYNGYKSGRVNKAKLHRFVNLDIVDENPTESFKNQLSRLELYLSELPMTTFMIDTLEADDVISYMCGLSSADENIRNIIVSTDKDFYQCINERTTIYSPIKKVVYDSKEIYDKYGVHHKNFIHYRILTGDNSDNISGVRNIGLTTLIKYIPDISTKELDMEMIYKHCEEQKADNPRRKFYSSILEAKDIIERNVELMTLSPDYLSGSDKILIRKFYDASTQPFNRMAFAKLFVEDGLNIYNDSFLFKLNNTFGSLQTFRK